MPVEPRPAKKKPLRRDISELALGNIPTWTYLHLLGENGESCGRVVMTNTADGILFTLSMDDPEDARIQDAYFLVWPEGAAEDEKHMFGETLQIAEGTRIQPVVGEINEFLTAKLDIQYGA